MDIYEILIPVYGYLVVAIGLPLVLLSNTFLYLKYTEEIIRLLKKAGYFELSKRMRNVVNILGKLPPRGGTSIKKEHYRVWKEFRQLEIKKDAGKIFFLQKAFKLSHSLFMIVVCIFIIPFIILGVYILYVTFT